MPRRSSAARAITTAAPLFAALGDDTRLRLVARLCHGGPASISKLTEGADVTRQAIAKHLRVLEDAGVVRGTREGRESQWELAPERLKDARACIDLISTQWDEALERLQAFVER